MLASDCYSLSCDNFAARAGTLTAVERGSEQGESVGAFEVTFVQYAVPEFAFWPAEVIGRCVIFSRLHEFFCEERSLGERLLSALGHCPVAP